MIVCYSVRIMQELDERERRTSFFLQLNSSQQVSHLFFDCCVAKVLRTYLSDIFHISLGTNFESVARWWVSNRKYKVMNCFSATLMWCLWKFRNEMCFQGKGWKGEKILLQKLCNMVKKWRILFSEGDLELLDQVLTSLYSKLAQTLGLPNVSQNSATRSSPGNGSSLETFPGRASTNAHWANTEDDGVSTTETNCITACASVLPICDSLDRLATLNSSGRASNTPWDCTPELICLDMLCFYEIKRGTFSLKKKQ